MKALGPSFPPYGPNFCSFPAFANAIVMTLTAGIRPIDPDAQVRSLNSPTPSPE